MLSAIVSLTLLGAVLGLGLGIAARKFAVEVDPLIGDLEAMMPGSNCGQCGQPGCAGAARAIAARSVPVTCWPPRWRPSSAFSWTSPPWSMKAPSWRSFPKKSASAAAAA